MAWSRLRWGYTVSEELCARLAAGATLAVGGSVIKCPSPRNDLKDYNMYDHSCYCARSDEYQHLMTDSPTARPPPAVRTSSTRTGGGCCRSRLRWTRRGSSGRRWGGRGRQSISRGRRRRRPKQQQRRQRLRRRPVPTNIDRQGVRKQQRCMGPHVAALPMVRVCMRAWRRAGAA